MKKNTPTFPVIRCWLILFWLTGCATTRPPEQPGPSAAATPHLVAQYGRVVRVNQDMGYVVLECAALPRTGEEFTLMRDGRPAGKVRINPRMSGKYAAADILEGRPMPGDWFMGDKPVTTE